MREIGIANFWKEIPIVYSIIIFCRNIVISCVYEQFILLKKKIQFEQGNFIKIFVEVSHVLTINYNF